MPTSLFNNLGEITSSAGNSCHHYVTIVRVAEAPCRHGGAGAISRCREERALATILEKFINEDLRPWTKTFPYEFYELLYKPRRWSGPDGHKRTHQVGRDTNDLVYERLAPGVLTALQRLNPVVSPGYRRNKHHQWFTPEFGDPRLKEHLAGVMALMRAAPNWTAFHRSLQRAYPKMREQIPLALGDEE